MDQEHHLPLGKTPTNITLIFPRSALTCQRYELNYAGEKVIFKHEDDSGLYELEVSPRPTGVVFRWKPVVSENQKTRDAIERLLVNVRLEIKATDGQPFRAILRKRHLEIRADLGRKASDLLNLDFKPAARIFDSGDLGLYWDPPASGSWKRLVPGSSSFSHVKHAEYVVVLARPSPPKEDKKTSSRYVAEASVELRWSGKPSGMENIVVALRQKLTDEESELTRIESNGNKLEEAARKETRKDIEECLKQTPLWLEFRKRMAPQDNGRLPVPHAVIEELRRLNSSNRTAKQNERNTARSAWEDADRVQRDLHEGVFTLRDKHGFELLKVKITAR